MSAKLTIQTVGWNSAKELPETLAALGSIPRAFVVIRYIDNASSDNSVELVRRMLPQAEVIELKENQGFSGAHNIGLARCDTEFVLTCDPDLALNWPGVEKLLQLFEDEDLGAVQGKLLRRKTDEGRGDIIDSAGIEKTLALNGRERGANEIDEGQFDKPAKLWAVTGACGLYRMTALREVAHSEKEFFDQDFFAYKEDVDLGWRLNKAGWKVLYEPVIMGVHKRTLGRRGVFNWGLNPIGVYARLKSPRTRYSLRNWVWMILKNASFKELLLHEVFIDLRLLVFGALSVAYLPLFKVWPEIIKGAPNMMDKRERKD